MRDHSLSSKAGNETSHQSAAPQTIEDYINFYEKYGKLRVVN